MFSQRIERAAASGTQRITAEVDRLRRQGVDIVDLGAGEPDFATPPHVKAAAVAAIDEGFTRYTPNAGVRELREAICRRYGADYGVTFEADQVIATAGGKQALFNTAMALFDAGDEVITHAPGWPSIVEQVKLAGAVPVAVRTHPEDGFRLHADAVLEAFTPRTRAVVVNSPGNPTGALVTAEDLARIAGKAAEHGAWVVLDLCYEQLIYDDAPHNLPRGAPGAPARSVRGDRQPVEGPRHDRLALWLGHRAAGLHPGVQHRAGPRHFQRGVHHAAGRG